MTQLILTLIAIAVLATIIGIITFIAFAFVIIQEFTREGDINGDRK